MSPPHLLDPFMTLPDDAASKDCILFPVWKPGHWSLSVLLPKRLWIYQFDSPNTSGLGDINYLNMFSSIALRLLPVRSWKVIKTKNMLTQGEGPDCGVFMLMYALYMALDWTVDFSQEDIPQLRRWWCRLILDSMSPASVSESTTTKESPPRHPVVCQQEDNDEVCEKNVKCRFVQDIGPAWSWVQTHRAFFRGEVMEPAYLQMDDENQQRLLEEYLRGDLEARDAFLFEFECAEDLDTFISNCNEKQGLKVHAMIKE